MGTIADKLNYLNTTKGNIKSAIIAKGVSVSDSDTFRSYADKIADIEPTLGTKTITANGTYNATSDSLDGYSEVTVDVDGYTIVDDTTPASIKTLTTAPYPMGACKVRIEAQQDLNGYSKPWVGGANVNKFPNALSGTQTSNGITVVSDGKGIYTISGTAEAYATITFDLVDEFTFPTSVGSGGNGVIYLGNDFLRANAVIAFLYDNTLKGNFAFNATDRKINSYSELNGQTINRVAFYINSGVEISGTASPMVVSNSSTTETWSPYSNICPITGWDAVNLNVCAKNLYNKNEDISANNFYIISDGTQVTSENYRTTNPFKIKPNTTYFWAINGVPVENIANHQAPRVAYYDKDMNWLSSGSELGNTGSASASPSNAVYVRLPVYIKSSGVAQAMFVEGDTMPTTYEPYNGQTYTESLATTNYGGYWDAVDGEVINGTKYYADLSQLTWARNSANQFLSYITDAPKQALANTHLCSAYQPSANGAYTGNVDQTISITGNAIWIRDSRFDATSDFKSALSGVQLVYELATPTTTSTTPRVIDTNNGVTNVWADSGKVERVKYLTPLS